MKKHFHYFIIGVGVLLVSGTVILLLQGNKQITQNNPRLVCTQMGCGPTAQILTDLPISFDKVRTTKLELCQNETCTTTYLSNLTNAPEPLAGTGTQTIRKDEMGMLETNVMADKNGKLYLQINWYAWNINDVKNGDAYTVNLQDSSGTKIISFKETTEYNESYPNGKDCDPSPCRSVIIDKRTKGTTILTGT